MPQDPRLTERKLHMTVVYPDGTVYNGKRDLRPIVDDLRLDSLPLDAWSVCDIAADEGFFAYWAEGKNAKRVVAIDVDDFGRYDWGFDRDEKFISEANQGRAAGGKRVFDMHHENINSRVEYFPDSIYDLRPEVHGTFDLLLNFGLLYHLRHPLMSFDIARRVCTGTMIVETQINNAHGADIPLMQFYPSTEHRSASDWSGLSTACVTHMMRNAGFTHMFYSKVNYPHRHRQIFVGCVTEQHQALFTNNPNLTYCDDKYWADCYEKSLVWDGKDWQLGTTPKPPTTIRTDAPEPAPKAPTATIATPAKQNSIATGLRKLFTKNN